MPKETQGLTGRKATILGKGNIGSRVGRILKAFDAEVSYFKRGDDLLESINSADLVVDTLSSNPTTHGLLDKKFFMSLKKGSYFITVTGQKIYDIDAMIESLDKGILAGAANDSGGIQVGNISDPFYRRLTKHPKILATPHIAYNTDITDRTGNGMMIDNIEAWLKGKPINLVK